MLNKKKININDGAQNILVCIMYLQTHDTTEYRAGKIMDKLMDGWLDAWMHGGMDESQFQILIQFKWYE